MNPDAGPVAPSTHGRVYQTTLPFNALGDTAVAARASGPATAPSDLHQPIFRLDERALPAGVRVLTHTALAALA